MDKSNLLPFSNLDPDMAQAVPNSSYMEFHVALMGMLIFSRETRQVVMKWEIFNLYRSRKDLLEQVINNEHKDYVLIANEKFNG